MWADYYRLSFIYIIEIIIIDFLEHWFLAPKNVVLISGPFTTNLWKWFWISFIFIFQWLSSRRKIFLLFWTNRRTFYVCSKTFQTDMKRGTFLNRETFDNFYKYAFHFLQRNIKYMVNYSYGTLCSLKCLLTLSP